MKNILFLTGTRADFGKIKSLLEILSKDENYNIHIFVTGMHMLKRYGYTCLEVDRLGFGEIYKFINQNPGDSMDIVMAKTMQGLSDYLKEHTIDMLVVHGDRVEALAGATTAALNNILVAHIEGGEVSGTIDELIRHAVSKLSHIHFVSNEEAGKRLIQLGENPEYVKVIGSPDMDAMLSPNLPTLSEVKEYYKFGFDKYSVVMYHPVTTEYENAYQNAENLVNALLDSDKNYIVIYPNNDHGSVEIIKAYKKLEGRENIKIYPSMRFEYFLTLLKNCDMMIGNSSAGVRECPFYGKPAVNIGSRQHKRVTSECIIDCGSYESIDILNAIDSASKKTGLTKEALFGTGNSAELFLEALKEIFCSDVKVQKHFIDLPA